MHYDVHLRAGVLAGIDNLVHQMREWEVSPRVDAPEASCIREGIQAFGHTVTAEGLRVGGVDGSGGFPALAYADSFVYFTLAQGTIYEASPTSGLREIGPALPPTMQFSWLAQDEKQKNGALEEAFAVLAGEDVDSVIRQSDYRALKANETGSASPTNALRDGLILPHASDAGNLAIQLRSTGELGAALRLLRGESVPGYVLVDGTLTLPFVSRKRNSLFYEHLKRLCCVEARTRGVGFYALSKSHGLPSVELVEDLARAKLCLEPGRVAEHWYFRVPTPQVDGWKLSLTEGRRLPPAGTVTYLVRFHRNMPVFRLDMDQEYWRQQIRGATEEETREHERHVFQDLDYACHDQRCYGYPYPIKAGHDRASLTETERVALRKQIIDAAVRAGMRRSLFRDASLATGHE